MTTDNLLRFVAEREAVRVRRAGGQPPPWTDDPIMREWSFCNVRREDDRVTRWIAANWRDPHATDPDLWHAMAVARLVNWPDSLAALGYPSPWQPEKFAQVLSARAARGEKVWGGAYIVSTNGVAAAKPEYVAGVLDRAWTRRASVRPRRGDSIHEFYGRLRGCDGFASFMAAQVAADVKYVEPLRSARDWHTFAAPGPGSVRGINRVLGLPVEKKWNEDDWRAALRKLRSSIQPELERLGLGDLHAQDLQNSLCEMDKYERVRLGEGKPKRRFTPRAA